MSGQTLLATLALHAAAAFAAPSGGVAIAGGTGYEIASANAVASGMATWLRVLKSDGTTVVFDGTVGTSGCNFNMNSNVISSGSSVGATNLTYSVVEAGN